MSDCKRPSVAIFGKRRGRPTVYASDRCEEVILFMRQGYSLTATAAAMGVSRGTLYGWARCHPEFLNALRVAQAARMFKLETDLLTSTNPVAIRRAMWLLKNADRGGWCKSP